MNTVCEGLRVRFRLSKICLAALLLFSAGACSFASGNWQADAAHKTKAAFTIAAPLETGLLADTQNNKRDHSLRPAWHCLACPDSRCGAMPRCPSSLAVSAKRHGISTPLHLLHRVLLI